VLGYLVGYLKATFLSIRWPPCGKPARKSWQLFWKPCKKYFLSKRCLGILLGNCAGKPCLYWTLSMENMFLFGNPFLSFLELGGNPVWGCSKSSPRPFSVRWRPQAFCFWGRNPLQIHGKTMENISEYHATLVHKAPAAVVPAKASYSSTPIPGANDAVTMPTFCAADFLRILRLQSRAVGCNTSSWLDSDI